MSLSDSLFAEPVTINGIPTIGNVSELKAEAQLVQAGYSYTYGLRIVLNRNKGIVPILGQTVIYNNNNYRILTVESDFISYTITCDSVNK